MKKILTVLAVIALTATVVANAAESRLENYVNKKLSPITQKEKDFNAKMEAQQKASEARQAELEKQRKEAQARRQATKDAIQAEKDYWKSLKK